MGVSSTTKESSPNLSHRIAELGRGLPAVHGLALTAWPAKRRGPAMISRVKRGGSNPTALVLENPDYALFPQGGFCSTTVFYRNLAG